MIDSLSSTSARRSTASRGAPRARAARVRLVTLHRPELVDDASASPRRSTRSCSSRRLPRSSSPCIRATRARLDGIGTPGIRLSSRPLGYRDFSASSLRAVRAHRLRRHPGGDERARRPLLHAARDDRAAGDGRAGDERRPRARPERIAEIPALLENRSRRRRSRSGTGTPAHGRPPCSPCSCRPRVRRRESPPANDVRDRRHARRSGRTRRPSMRRS